MADDPPFANGGAGIQETRSTTSPHDLPQTSFQPLLLTNRLRVRVVAPQAARKADKELANQICDDQILSSHMVPHIIPKVLG